MRRTDRTPRTRGSGWGSTVRRATSNQGGEHHEAIITQQYLDQAGQHRPLSADVQRDLGRRALAGDAKARQELIQSCLLLVVSIARRYQGRGLDFLDLVQEGNIGLLRAAEKWDPEKAARFSSYAVDWIQQRMSRAIYDTGRTIRIPIHRHDELRRLYRFRDQFRARHDRTPTVDETADALGIPPERVIELLQMNERTVSLDVPVDGGDAMERDVSVLSDFIPSQSTAAIRPEVYAEARRTLETIHRDFQRRWRRLCATTSKRRRGRGVQQSDPRIIARDRSIFIRRFGLNGEQPLSLEAIGEAHGLTRERVRQIERYHLRLFVPEAETTQAAHTWVSEQVERVRILAEALLEPERARFPFGSR